MYKSRHITDFFKSFGRSVSSTKRSRQEEDDDLEDTIALARRRTKSPKILEPSPEEDHNFKSTARSSSLTPIDSDASIDSSNGPQTKTAGVQTVPIATPGHSFGSHASNGPVMTSSQRVTKNGETIIKNSDDESDSDDSLEDLDDLLSNRKSPRISSPPTEPDLPPVSATAQTRHSSRRTGHARSAIKALPVVPKYRFSLDTLVAHAAKDDAAEARAAEARQLVDSLDHRSTALEVKVGKGQVEGNVNKRLLTTLVAQDGDEDNIDRLMHAIERTEALQIQKSWSFFDLREQADVSEQEEFPKVPRTAVWKGVVEDPSSRQEAFVSGLLGDIAAKGILPDEILSWILDTFTIEPNKSLQSAYIATLASAKDQLESLLKPTRVDELFRTLGAREEALHIGQPILPTQRRPSKSGDDNGSNWSRLWQVLELLSNTASRMSSETRGHLLRILCRLSLDSSAVADGSISIALESAFENIVSSIPASSLEKELFSSLNTIYNQVQDARLRLQLLKVIPASTTRLSLVRRKLALSFFFQDSSHLSNAPPDLINFSAIIHQLREPEFKITAATDYTRLAAAISILDIGIDDGDPPTSPFDVQAELDFNHEVDRLAKMVKSMFTRIIDSGASHMTRTEAKDVLEALHARLVYAVRTKPKPKKRLFGNGGPGAGTSWGGVDFMEKFLARKKAGVGAEKEGDSTTAEEVEGGGDGEQG